MPDSRPIDVLRMEEQAIGDMLDRLEQDGKRHKRRSSDRKMLRYRTRLRVAIRYPTRQEGCYWAYARDISEGGIGLLHGKFAYPRSRCVVELPRLDRSIQSQEGTVRWCDHLEGRAHLVGVEFDEPIDLTVFYKAYLQQKNHSD